MQETLEFIQLIERVNTAITHLPQQVATIAVNFSKDRFRSENWVDNTTEPWKKRKQGWTRDRRKGRAILVDSSRLKRSVRKVSVTADRIVIGTDVPYASVHNDGFRGRVTQHVGGYSRKKMGMVHKGTGTYSIRTHAERTRRVRSQVGSVSVKPYTRTINQNIPRRRFIGNSSVLNSQIERFITSQFIHAIKG